MFKLISFAVATLSANFAFAFSSQPNPVLTPWTGAYQGLPPFDQIKVKHFEPALLAAMDDAKKQYEKIADQATPATFDNTILPLEEIELQLERPMMLFGIWSSTLSDKNVQAIETRMAPKLAAFADAIVQNKKLFDRIATVYKAKKEGFSAEQNRLVWKHYTSFVKKGGAVSEDQKKRVAQINSRMAELTTSFSQNLLADENDDHLFIEKESDLGGLPAWLVTSAKAEAKKRGLKGWVIGNTRSSMQPFVTYSSNRKLREKAFRIWTSRGDNDNKNNNNKIASEILKLRAERSKIFGYKTYAHWQLSDKMAGDPKKAMDLMLRVWAPAKKQLRRDVRSMQKIVDQEKGGFKIQPWDYRYYAEKLRKKRYDFDMDSVKPYLQLANVQKAMFWMAGELYGFSFKLIDKAAVYHPDVKVYEVLKDKKVVGLWYFDPYARKGKRSGAWMNAYRLQNKLGGTPTLPIVSNNSNFVKGANGQATLLSWDDASTMFHEFGHALHGLSSDVTYPSLAGTSVARDFVEFPSQIHEDWLPTSKVLKFLTNAKGEAFPEKLVKKLKRAANFGQGFATTEYLASALVDMKLHLSSDANLDMVAFEKSTLKQLGMPSEVVMRHRIPQFAHVFTGEGYASGYYSYLWSDVLRQDAFKAFLEAKGPYDKNVAKRFQEKILSVGNTIDPAKAFRNFRGRDPKVEALLEAKGFEGSSKIQ